MDGDTYPTKADGKTRDYSNTANGWPISFAMYARIFNAPKMPFVIGVLGVDGLKANPGTVAFREAMAAPSLIPEFKGNVIAVQTAPFWADELAVIDAAPGANPLRRRPQVITSKPNTDPRS